MIRVNAVRALLVFTIVIFIVIVGPYKTSPFSQVDDDTNHLGVVHAISINNLESSINQLSKAPEPRSVPASSGRTHNSKPTLSTPTRSLPLSHQITPSATSELAAVREFFKDILVIVQFNYPNYHAIPNYRRLYGSVFTNMIFTGMEPRKRDNVTEPIIVLPETDFGRLGYRSLLFGLETYQNYTGYLYTNDDLMINYWHILHQRPSKDQVWYVRNWATSILGYTEQALDITSPITDPKKKMALVGFQHTKAPGSASKTSPMGTQQFTGEFLKPNVT